MIDAVFISDLHLHPQQEDITQRFHLFCQWAATNTRAIYILGDFFHVWPGDDALDDWSKSIAQCLADLSEAGIQVYYMHGNRDFLLGRRFAELAKISILADPSIITLDDERILLTHGDRYCTQDKSHQWLRRLTRNRVFTWFFLNCPYKIRIRLVERVRNHSQMNRNKSVYQLNIVPSTMLRHMRKMKSNILIHGHTHKPGLTTHHDQSNLYRQYVLSDWDDEPTIMCYYRSYGFYFLLFGVF